MSHLLEIILENDTVRWLRSPPGMSWWVRLLPGQKKGPLFFNWPKPVYIENPRHSSQLLGDIFLKYSLPSSIFALEMSICLKCLRRPAQVNVLYARECSDIWGMLRTPSILNSGWGTKFSIKSPVRENKNLTKILILHCSCWSIHNHNLMVFEYFLLQARIA